MSSLCMKHLNPCHLCGSREFSFGTVQGAGHASFFVVNGRGLMDALKGDKKSNLIARVCVNCKNLQCFAPDIDQDDRTDPATI
jgi:hypothetical protein